MNHRILIAEIGGLDVVDRLKRANVTDTLRLPPKEIEQLLTEIDRSASGSGSSRRRMRRRAMDGRKLVVAVIGVNGERKNIVAVGRNLSATGIGFLCGGFIHTDLRCVVALRSVDGKAHGIGGVIMRCNHIKGNLHDIGVRFDEAIKATDFMDMEDDDGFAIENVDPNELEGQLLVVEDSRADQRLIAHHLKETNLELTLIGDGEGGLQSLGDQPDLVLVNYNLPDMTAIEWVKKAREQGLTRPVLMLTADKSAEVATEAREAGYDAIITKPITGKGLMQAIAEFLVGDRSSHAQAPKRSLGLNEELLEQFVGDLHKYAEEIADAIEKQDPQIMRSLLLAIAGAAAGHGFASVSELAEHATTALSTSMDINDAMTDIQRLVAACQGARMPKSTKNVEEESTDEPAEAA